MSVWLLVVLVCVTLRFADEPAFGWQAYFWPAKCLQPMAGFDGGVVNGVAQNGCNGLAFRASSMLLDSARQQCSPALLLRFATHSHYLQSTHKAQSQRAKIQPCDDAQ